MQEELVLFGPVDVYLAPVMEFIVFGLVLLNMALRHRAHSLHKRQAADGGAEAITRYTPHVASNIVLLLATFYYMTIHHHGGMVLSVLVLAMLISDLFEFESRKVEARSDLALDLPKAAIGASVFVFLYSAYDALFFLIADYWSLIV